jgi:hypothetical protein
VEGRASTNQARIQAYDKLKSLIVDKSSFGETAFQLDKSVKTIQKRALQLATFTLAVRRGQFRTAANILRIPEPRNRHPVRESGSNWLEYHLGIEPLVKDIYNAVDLIQHPVKPKHLVARGWASEKWSQYNPAPWSVSNYWELSKIRIQYQCDVEVSNPTLWLANSLGIVNPAQVAWQLVPLSFILDWFVNVESFLGQASDFWGLNVTNASTTLTYFGQWKETWSVYGWISSYGVYGMTRSLGLILPSLGKRPVKALSWQRGLTAVSLLLNELKSLEPEKPLARKKRGKFHKFSLHGDL